MGLIPSLLGNNDLEKLRAVLDFRNHTLRFYKPRSSALRATRYIILQPGQSKHMSRTGRMPVALKSGDAVLNSTQLSRKLAPGAMLVTVSKGSYIIPVKNLSKKMVTIHKNAVLGHIDFSSSFGSFTVVTEFDTKACSLSTPQYKKAGWVGTNCMTEKKYIPFLMEMTSDYVWRTTWYWNATLT